MKYLTIFKINDFVMAEAHDNKQAAEDFVQKCAKAGKTKALKNQENESYIIEVTNAEKTQEIQVEIQKVDTEIKYELSYDQNGNHVETSFHPTRTTLVNQAKKILDQLGYEAAAEETTAGKWAIDNDEQNLHVTLTGKIALIGSEESNIIAEYANPDMVQFFKTIDTSLARLAAEQEILTADALKVARKRGFTNLGIGLAIAAGGALLTFFSYSTAKVGERYTVFTGLIAVGIIDALCGIYYIIRPKAALPKKKAKK